MSFKNKYIVATRPSLLATTQSEQTVNLLREKFPSIEFILEKFSTHGDQVTDKPLTEFGGTGVFVKELEMAMDRGEADFAIHSLKDVPSFQPENFVIASFPKREDPRDIILTRDNVRLAELPEECVIGTSSPRRLVQIAKLKPKAIFKDIRGNIDTRMKKLYDGEYDAIVLAAAGIKRLGKHIDEMSYLTTDQCIPAIGQGIIGLECKKDDIDTINLLRSINDEETEICAIAERSFMAEIGGGCKFPLAVHATINGDQLNLSAMIGNHKTYQILYKKSQSTTDNALETGVKLGEEIKKEAESLGINFMV